MNKVRAMSVLLRALPLTTALLTLGWGATPGQASSEGSFLRRPDSNFRYDASLAGYIFNLSTKPLSTGTWVLSFTVGADPTVQHVQFDVK